MPKRKIREDLKKQDLLLSTFEKWKIWVKENTRTSIIIVAVVLLVGLSGWAFASYRINRNERNQRLLSAGIASFQEYTISGKAEALPKAEADFKRVAQNSSDGLRDAAELYLARIAAIKGNGEEAKKIYNRIARKPSNDITKKLAQTGLQNVEKGR